MKKPIQCPRCESTAITHDPINLWAFFSGYDSIAMVVIDHGSR